MRGDSAWLDNVMEAFNELGVNLAHRKQIAEKVREIRERKGLHVGNYVAWTQYVLGHYSRGKSWCDFFHPVRLGSGWWEYLEMVSCKACEKAKKLRARRRIVELFRKRWSI